MTNRSELPNTQERLLQASIELLEKDHEISQLKATVALLEARIAIMQCKLQRSRLPFSARKEAISER